MPSTMVFNNKPGEAARKTKPVPVKATSGAETEPTGSSVRKGRASSWTRRARDRNLRGTTEPQEPNSRPSCGRRARSTSTAPKATENGSGTDPNHRRATSCARRAVDLKPRVQTGCSRYQTGCSQDQTECPAQRERVQAEPKAPIISYKAFTIIPPDPKKRREIQKKAEAELAALEKLRLSRAMSYVSINPSSVGGCLSLEEVRLKQQQEMMQAKRKHKQVNLSEAVITKPQQTF